MDSFQNNFEYENRIVPEDRDKLISLLEEYSIKLRKRCDLIDRNSRIFYLTFIFSFVSSTVILIAFLFRNYPEIFTSTLTPIAIYAFAIAFGYSIFGMRHVLSMARKRDKIDSHNHEAHSLAYRLEKLVRIASEFYEHVEKKTISKIELDLKISEAESVLNYYDSIIGKPKIYSGKKWG
jgi:hypothetical protein